MVATLELRDLTAGYGPKTVFQGLDLSVPLGQVTSVLGPGGSGKSTLLRVLAREDSSPMWSEGAEAVPAALWLPQRRAPSPTVHDVANDQARSCLRAAGVDPLRPEIEALLRSPLGGPHVAAILNTDRTLLLLDEPDTHMDALARAGLSVIVRVLTEREKTVLLVTHHLAFARQCSSRAIVMLDGLILDTGDWSHLHGPKSPQRVRDFMRWGA